MTLALGSALLALLNLASAAHRRTAPRRMARRSRRADSMDLVRPVDAATRLPVADTHLRAGVRARVAESAKPGPPAVWHG